MFSCNITWKPDTRPPPTLLESKINLPNVDYCNQFNFTCIVFQKPLLKAVCGSVLQAFGWFWESMFHGWSGVVATEMLKSFWTWKIDPSPAFLSRRKHPKGIAEVWEEFLVVKTIFHTSCWTTQTYCQNYKVQKITIKTTHLLPGPSFGECPIMEL